MTIADRIQTLRKQSGLSQEQLAERLDVSRQAVSKWESGQSIPDVDKIIALSELFETTTDYLLKGTQPQPDTAENSLDSALLCAGAGTIINAAGLIAAIMVWKEWQTELSVGIGLILMLLGTGIFLAGQVIGGQKRTRARRLFILPNVWLLSFIPFSCAFNVLNGLVEGYIGLITPVPMIGNSIPVYVLCWIGYLVICGAADLVLAKKL